jgi:hypothetical protein
LIFQLVDPVVVVVAAEVALEEAAEVASVVVAEAASVEAVAVASEVVAAEIAVVVEVSEVAVVATVVAVEAEDVEPLIPTKLPTQEELLLSKERNFHSERGLYNYNFYVPERLPRLEGVGASF